MRLTGTLNQWRRLLPLMKRYDDMGEIVAKIERRLARDRADTEMTIHFDGEDINTIAPFIIMLED